jgi:RNA polymerase sigma factor (sigma-70 family)
MSPDSISRHPDSFVARWAAESTVSTSGPHGTTFARLAREIVRLVRQYAKRDADAEDWGSELALHIAEERLTVNPCYLQDPTSVAPFVHRWICNRRVDRHRVRKARERREAGYHAEDADTPRYGLTNPETDLELQMLTRIARDTIDMIPEPYRSIYLRVRSAELSYDDAAAEFGVKKSYVQTAMKKAHALLHAHLDPHLDSHGQPRRSRS